MGRETLDILKFYLKKLKMLVLKNILQTIMPLVILSTRQGYLLGNAHSSYTVERKNQLLQRYLTRRFAQKNYCQSKSTYMIENSVLLYYE